MIKGWVTRGGEGTTRNMRHRREGERYILKRESGRERSVCQVRGKNPWGWKELKEEGIEEIEAVCNDGTWFLGKKRKKNSSSFRRRERIKRDGREEECDSLYLWSYIDDTRFKDSSFPPSCTQQRRGWTRVVGRRGREKGEEKGRRLREEEERIVKDESEKRHGSKHDPKNQIPRKRFLPTLLLLPLSEFLFQRSKFELSISSAFIPSSSWCILWNVFSFAISRTCYNHWSWKPSFGVEEEMKRWNWNASERRRRPRGWNWNEDEVVCEQNDRMPFG